MDPSDTINLGFVVSEREGNLQRKHVFFNLK